MLRTWLLALLLVAGSGAAIGAETQASFDAVYTAAEAARKQAANLGHEWRDTGKMLKQAKAAAKKADFDNAVKLAQQAQLQGERASEQAQLQTQTWQQSVPK